MVTANRRHPPGRSAPRPPTLSGQALGLERLDDVRPRTYALDVAPQLRPLAEVDFDMAGPAEHGEQVGVGDGVLRAHQETLRSQRTLQVVEARRQVLARVLLGSRRCILAKQRREALVHLRVEDRKSTRLNSSHVKISYAVFCLKQKSSSGSPPTCT